MLKFMSSRRNFEVRSDPTTACHFGRAALTMDATKEKGGTAMRREHFIGVGLVVALMVAIPLSAGEFVKFGGMWIDEWELEKYQAMAPTQTGSDSFEKETSFGPNNWSNWTVGPSDAAVRGGVVSFTQTGNYLEYNASTGTASFTLPIHLPHGAAVQWVYVWYYDNDPSSNPSMGFYSGNTVGGSTLVTGMDPSGVWSGGNTRAQFSFSHTADNWNNHYYILALFSKTASVRERFYKLTVWYKLQVSPAPGSATFGDVPTGHFFFREIEAMADSGVSGGCGSGNYCPDAPVTRAQMAAFLSRALGLSWSSDVTP